MEAEMVDEVLMMEVALAVVGMSVDTDIGNQGLVMEAG